MDRFKYRLIQMLLGWGTVGLVYKTTSLIQGPGYVIAPSFIDEMILFSPAAVWLYLSFFLLVPLAWLICPLPQARWLRQAIQLTAVLCGVVYLIWPTTMVYPENPPGTVHSRLLDILIAVDTPQNCLPSLHMAITLLAIWAVAARGNFLITLLLGLWGAAITFSILQLERHLFIDLVAGAVLATLVGFFCRYRMLSGMTLQGGSR